MTDKNEEKEVKSEEAKTETTSSDEVHNKLLQSMKELMEDNKKTREAVSDFMAKKSDSKPSQEKEEKADGQTDSDDLSLNADEINSAIVSKF